QMQFPPVRFSTKVDTSAAGFQATPDYTVRLIGERRRVGSAAPPNFYLFDAVIDVATQPAPTPQAFWGDVFPFFWTVVQTTTDLVTISNTLFAEWRIDWIGIES